MAEIPRGIGAIIAFALGACAGSFVSVVAYRLPREISIVRPGSFCPHCERPIPWWANIPLFAYLGLRGRCLMCGASIPLRYFLTEVTLAAAAAWLLMNFSLPDAIARFVFCAALFAVALVDYDWRLIPNAITFPATLAGFAAASLVMPEVGWLGSLIGIIIGAGALFLTGEIYRLVRGIEGVGLGDVWLLGMTGAFIGWIGVLFTLFFGALLGSVGGLIYALGGGAPGPTAGGRETEQAEQNPPILQTAIPFGPFLAFAAAVFTLFEPQLRHWYLSR